MSTTVNPYLTFNGNCEEAFIFYKSIFGGEWMMMKFKDMPAMPGQEMPANVGNMVGHVSLPISKETCLMASDANPMIGNVTIGQNVSISITTDTKEEADRIFKGISTGGQITSPIADMFWGAYWGLLTDKFGIIWMVSYNYPKK